MLKMQLNIPSKQGINFQFQRKLITLCNCISHTDLPISTNKQALILYILLLHENLNSHPTAMQVRYRKRNFMQVLFWRRAHFCLGWASLMRLNLCRPTESNKGRRTIRFNKGDSPFVRQGTFCIVWRPAAAELWGIAAPSPATCYDSCVEVTYGLNTQWNKHHFYKHNTHMVGT